MIVWVSAIDMVLVYVRRPTKGAFPSLGDLGALTFENIGTSEVKLPERVEESMPR